jgi:hypothetical protein
MVRKKLGLRLESEKTDGERVYRIVAALDGPNVSSWHEAGGYCGAASRRPLKVNPTHHGHHQSVETGTPKRRPTVGLPPPPLRSRAT